MSAVCKILFVSCILSLVVLNEADGNDASNSNLASITNIQGLPGKFPGVPDKLPGMSGDFVNISPEVKEDVMKLMTDPCTYKTLKSLAKLSSDMRAAREKKEGEKKN